MLGNARARLAASGGHISTTAHRIDAPAPAPSAIKDTRRPEVTRSAGEAVAVTRARYRASTPAIGKGSTMAAELRRCIGLAPGFAGRDFTRELLEDLPPDVDPCGENGEFHTCVYAGPMFRAPLALAPGETVSHEPFVWMELTQVAGDA